MISNKVKACVDSLNNLRDKSSNVPLKYKKVSKVITITFNPAINVIKLRDTHVFIFLFFIILGFFLVLYWSVFLTKDLSGRTGSMF